MAVFVNFQRDECLEKELRARYALNGNYYEFSVQESLMLRYNIYAGRVNEDMMNIIVSVVHHSGTWNIDLTRYDSIYPYQNLYIYR